MMDISKGKYWDKPWSLVDGCTPCSPGCDHCWAASMAHRYIREGEPGFSTPLITDANRRFNGTIITYPDRLNIPIKCRKPTIYSVWNDLFHEDIPDELRHGAYAVMSRFNQIPARREGNAGRLRPNEPQHKFLILTKRPAQMVKYLNKIKRSEGGWWTHNGAWPESYSSFNKDGVEPGKIISWDDWPLSSVWHGLAVCNQQEADEKIPVFLQVPGKKFLSIEPCLGPVDIERYLWLVSPSTAGPWRDYTGKIVWYGGGIGGQMISSNPSGYINAVILGGETGPGARPMHPDWVRSVRDQCEASGVPFFFKQWGEYIPRPTPARIQDSDIPPIPFRPGCPDPYPLGWVEKGKSRLLDGREHNDLPWVKVVEEGGIY